MTLAIDAERYQRYAAKNPYRNSTPPPHNFKEFVTSGTTSEVIQAATEFIGMTQREEFSSYQEISNTLAFVQSISYSLDEDSTGKPEYYRYPIETLYEVTGDCEDTTILAASTLQCMGHKVIVLVGPSHAALGVAGADGFPDPFRAYPFKDRRYFYCETTAEGWKVGEVPPHYQIADFKAYEV
jgi:hypothetical protein